MATQGVNDRSATGSRVIIPLGELAPGVTLPAPISDSRDASLLLLGRGVVLTADSIARLRDRGISHVSVDARYASALRQKGKGTGGKNVRVETRLAVQDKRLQPLAPLQPRGLVTRFDPTLVSASRTRHAAQHRMVASFYDALETNVGVNERLLKDMSLSAVNDMLHDVDVHLKVIFSDQEDLGVANDSLRTAKLAMAIGLTVEMTRDDILALAIGCVTVRAGTTEKGRYLASLNRPLTESELHEIRKAPGRAYGLIEKLTGIPMAAKQVVYQIREYWDGSGYPRQRAGNQIHRLARIAAVADVFIALTTDRPHRKALSPYRAVEKILQQTVQGKFDPWATRALISTIGVFPVGSLVRLSNGAIGEVIRIDPTRYDKPVVQILRNPAGYPPTSDELLDLRDMLFLEIESALDELPTGPAESAVSPAEFFLDEDDLAWHQANAVHERAE